MKTISSQTLYRSALIMVIITSVSYVFPASQSTLSAPAPAQTAQLHTRPGTHPTLSSTTPLPSEQALRKELFGNAPTRSSEFNPLSISSVITEARTDLYGIRSQISDTSANLAKEILAGNEYRAKVNKRVENLQHLVKKLRTRASYQASLVYLIAFAAGYIYESRYGHNKTLKRVLTNSMVSLVVGVTPYYLMTLCV